MSKTTRLIIFLVFVLAFLISAPLVVLYTAGYRLDLSHGRIVHTAVLNISSTPRNATVLVDTQTFRDRTPAVIETILPGEHLVTLTKTGYLSWETILSFSSREARVLGPIGLFLDEAPFLQETLSTSLIVAHPKTNRFAYVTQESSWLEVWVVDAASTQKKLLMRLPFDVLGVYDLTWSKDGTYLLLTESHGSQQDLHVTKTSNGSVIVSPTLDQPIDASWWDTGVDEALFVRSSTTLSRIDMHSGDVEVLTIQADLVSTYSGQRVLLSQGNNRAVVSIQEGDAASILTYLPLGDYTFVDAPDGLTALHDTHRNRLILIDLSNREQPIVFNEEVIFWKWGVSQNVLLYSSGYDLNRYVRSAHETQTITRLSTRIDGLDWYPEGSVAIYWTSGKTIALNLDSTDILSETTLATDLTGTAWLDPDGTQLNVITQTEEGSSWWTRRLQN